MVGVVIISKNRDFTEVVLDLAERELGVICHVVSEEREAQKWPGALCIHDKNQPVKMQPLLENIRVFCHSRAQVFGAFRYHPQQKTLSVTDGKTTILTDKEAQIFSLLAAAGSRGIAKDQLLTSVWGAAATELESHSLETHLYRLRAKLDEIGAKNALLATPGGYVLELV